VIITYKRLHKLQVPIYRMRVTKAIAKCIQRLVDTENEVRVFGTETQNLESVSVRCSRYSQRMDGSAALHGEAQLRN
jgi:hypothetical protein